MVQTATSAPPGATPPVPSLFGTPATPGTPGTAVPSGTPVPAGTPVPTPPPATPVAETVGVSVSTLLAGSFPAEPMGFFTDTSVCIGCKACEVACKEWNGIASTNGGQNTLSGNSYDNTVKLDGEHWRHVKFIEQFSDRSTGRWLMMSDVCKHCVRAGCLEVCPTGAIIRTEFDTVVIQSDVCNGCRACIAACPYGVIDINPVNNTAMKCTLCYDRMQNGLTPACAQACPTNSIQFGTMSDLRQSAQSRLEQLQSSGNSEARLYGHDDEFLGGLNSFYLLLDEPEVYGLPSSPKLPSHDLPSGSLMSAAGAVAMAAIGIVGLRKRRMDQFAAEARANGAAPPVEGVDDV
jgi:formate dehydrogenase iron-sulfur subunit